ncbi:MAG: hypothetical protein J6K89_07975 [Oscillospiraceae bacterium]|nr:hypothetical protein [Oscillospiraceae bacterium]
MDDKEKKPREKKPMGRILSELFSDLVIIVGIVAVAAGAGMIYPPAGYVVGGAELIVLGYLTAP